MKILVVEDEHRIANTIKKGLEQEKYTADVSYTGVDGYDLASTGDYDVIILDLMLPGMSGLEIVGRMRKEGNHTPVLILTAKGQLQDKVEGLDKGADDYLTKPFSFEELLARVRALGRRPRQALGETLRAGELTLDTKTYRVARSGKDISVSGKEYKLLVYLLRNKNTIVSKDTVIQHVWDYDTDILPNTVEVYIRNLRRKIDLPFGSKKPLIKTVRGFGYTIRG